VPSVITPVAIATTVSVPINGEPRTAASVDVAFQAISNNVAYEGQRFDQSVHDKWAGALSNQAGALAQAVTASFVAFSDPSSAVTFPGLQATDTLRVRWIGNFRKVSGSTTGALSVRMRISSPSQAAVTIASNQVQVDAASVDGYGEISLQGAHVAAFSETYTVTIEIAQTASGTGYVVFSGALHIRRTK
jgi:hypothetical protein